MSRKLIGIGGVPGTGKTTLMRHFMSSFDSPWERVKPVQLVDCEYNKEHNLYIMGKYDEGEVFAGTDKLSMAVQPKALEFIESQKDLNLVFEGDRLFNGSFVRSLMDLPDTELKIILLTAPQSVLNERYKERGSEQDQKFLDGRRSKYDNMRSSFDLMDLIEEYENVDEGDMLLNVNTISSFFFK